MGIAEEVTVSEVSSNRGTAPRRARLIAVLALLMAVNACGLTTPRVRSTAVGPPSSRQLSEFWVDADVRGRALFYGIGGPELAPDADAHYELVKTKPRGFSPKFDVRGPNGQEWSVKLGPEAQTEWVAS